MIDPPSQRRARYALAGFLVTALSIAAQTSTPTSGPAIPLREEGHHHLVFHNSYVNVFFVEIPPHETTLPHHHDLPYVSIQPGGADAAPETPSSLRIGYATGNFSHAVTNSRAVTLRNIAVELVRPQGTVRDRCAAIVSDRVPDVCKEAPVNAGNPSKHTPLLETDEILIESWEFAPGASTPPLDCQLDMLIGGLTDIQVAGNSGLDSANAMRGGILWIPAGSNPVFKASADRGGHFIAITFKDSAAR